MEDDVLVDDLEECILPYRFDREVLVFKQAVKYPEALCE